MILGCFREVAEDIRLYCVQTMPSEATEAGAWVGIGWDGFFFGGF
jgi:hypothetical protein